MERGRDAGTRMEGIRRSRMAKKKKPVEINRSKYNQIRKMDHHSMEECIAGYYDQGYAAGYEAGQKEAADPFNTEKAMASISLIKGIGTVRMERIHEILVAAGARSAGRLVEDLMDKKAAGGQQPEKI